MPICVEQAVELSRAAARLLEEEQVPLSQALGRTLSRPVLAPRPQPPFDRSPLDGYALRAADVASASKDSPALLHVTEKVCAGQVPSRPLGSGGAVRIMTGAMLPQGADCVIRQEDTDLGEEWVQIFRSVAAGENLCLAGEEYPAGALLLERGIRADAAALAVAAGAGMERLWVRRRARTAIIATGDELCAPGCPLPPGKVYDANTAYLEARLGQLGTLPTASIRAGDTLEGIVRGLESCAGCDLIVTTGGVSVGERDLMEQALTAWGAEGIFHGVDMKPGMPTLLARRGGTVVLALSGNPFAAAVAFELFARPVLGRMMEDAGLEMERTTALAATDFQKRGRASRRYLRGRLERGMVTVPGTQRNGQMQSMVGCNCLVELPGGSMRQGDRVDVWML